MSRELLKSPDPYIDGLRPPVVVCLGPEGTYSDIIGHLLFAPIPEEYTGTGRAPRAGFVLRGSFSDINQELVHNPGWTGILPVHNTRTSPVPEVIDCLLDGKLRVLGGAALRVSMVLAGTGKTIEGITTVVSYTKAIAQAKHVIENNNLHVEGSSSTAAAAEEVAARGDNSVVALCSKSAAKRFGLNILAEDVQDASDNITNFLIVRAMAQAREDIRGEALELIKKQARKIDTLKIAGLVRPTISGSHGFDRFANYIGERGLTYEDLGKRFGDNGASGDRVHFVEIEGSSKQLATLLEHGLPRQDHMRFQLIGAYPVESVYEES